MPQHRPQQLPTYRLAHPQRQRRLRYLNVRCLALVLCLLAVTPAQAQLRYRLELSSSAELLSSQGLPEPTLSWGVAARLDADYRTNIAQLYLVLEPGMRLRSMPNAAGEYYAGELGLLELYAVRTVGHIDISAGLERLPLETARLSIPFSVETIQERNLRQGLIGMRASWFPRSGLRLRAGLFYQDERLLPLLSVRQRFGSFELEAHALYVEEFVVGIGGSGLLGDAVVYGELWWLSQGSTLAQALRGALGVSINPGFGSVNAEFAYVPLELAGRKIEGSPGDLSEGIAHDNSSNVRSDALPTVLAQAQFSLDSSRSISVNSGAIFDPDGTVLRLGAGYSESDFDSEWSANLLVNRSPGAWSVGLRIEVKGFF